MRKRIIRVNKRMLFYAIILFIYIKPSLLEYIDSVDRVYDILKIPCGLFVLYLYFEKIVTKKKQSIFMLLIMLYNGLLIFSTVINKGDIVQSIATFTVNTVVCMISDLMLNDGPDYFFKPYITVLDIYMVINLLSLFIYPDGYAEMSVYFLGIDNRFIFFFLPLICFRFCYSHYKFGNIRRWDIIIYVLCLFTLVYRWSVGAMIGLLCYIPFLLIIYKSKYISKVLNMYTYTICTIVLNYLVLIKQVQYQFRDFLVNVLHKDPTFTYRTLIWERAIYNIKRSPLYGFGIGFEEITKQNLHGAGHPHNYFLTICYRGGALYLFVFICIVGITMHSLVKSKEKALSSIIAYTIFVSFIMSVADSFDFAMFFVIFLLGYNLDRVGKNVGKL